MLDLLEQAIEVWAELAGRLVDAYHSRRVDPRRSVNRSSMRTGSCANCSASRGEDVADRLNRLLERSHHNVVDVTAFAELLGEHASSVRLPARW